MQITTTICDLCKDEIKRNTEQSHFEYWLPMSKKPGEEDKLVPHRYNLCENCANLIKETCECIKAEADLRE